MMRDRQEAVPHASFQVPISIPAGFEDEVALLTAVQAPQAAQDRRWPPDAPAPLSCTSGPTSGSIP
jgi:hypothetical protein